jgi:hypothetical protein
MVIINMRIRGLYQPLITNAKKQVIINAKSDITSRYAPLFEVESIFLAILPSKIFVMPAKTIRSNEIRMKSLKNV